MLPPIRADINQHKGHLFLDRVVCSLAYNDAKVFCIPAWCQNCFTYLDTNKVNQFILNLMTDVLTVPGSLCHMFTENSVMFRSEVKEGNDINSTVCFAI